MTSCMRRSKHHPSYCYVLVLLVLLLLLRPAARTVLTPITSSFCSPRRRRTTSYYQLSLKPAVCQTDVAEELVHLKGVPGPFG